MQRVAELVVESDVTSVPAFYPTEQLHRERQEWNCEAILLRQSRVSAWYYIRTGFAPCRARK
jgi:hypothetical protein